MLVYQKTIFNFYHWSYSAENCNLTINLCVTDIIVTDDRRLIEFVWLNTATRNEVRLHCQMAQVALNWFVWWTESRDYKIIIKYWNLLKSNLNMPVLSLSILYLFCSLYSKTCIRFKKWTKFGQQAVIVKLEILPGILTLLYDPSFHHK